MKDYIYIYKVSLETKQIIIYNNNQLGSHQAAHQQEAIVLYFCLVENEA